MTAVFKAADPTAIIDGRQSLFVITAPNVDAAARGPRGFAATVAVGTVTTGAVGSSASVVNVGTAEDAVFNFTIPRGNTGAAATVAVGTVTTGAPGSSASVDNVGTGGAAIFNFSIPRGADGTGTVNSVQASGGTTGLSFSGGPITNSGTLTLSGTLSISNGGTGATTAATARTALGLGTVSTENTVPITKGGTGATTAAAARTALGLGSMATVNSPVPIANGGTGATTAAAARTALGAVGFSDFVDVINTNGYYAAPSPVGKMYFQWGYGTSVAGTGTLITLPIAFPNSAVLHLNAVPIGAPNGWIISVLAVSASQFRVFATDLAGNVVGGITFYWMAMGV